MTGHRFNATDEMMWWNIQRTRSTRTIQAVITTARPITDTEIATLRDQLEASHLGRVPVAGTPEWVRRPRWEPARGRRGELAPASRNADLSLTDWLDEQVYTPLSEGQWRLAAHRGPSSTVSLVVPHLYTDGAALVRALAGYRREPQSATAVAARDCGPAITTHVAAEDPAIFRTRYVRIPLSQIGELAAATGTTVNTVVVHAVCRAYCQLLDRASVVVGIPVSTRAPDAPVTAANELTVVPVPVAAGESLTATAARLARAVADPRALRPARVGPRSYALLPTSVRRRLKRPGTAAVELLISNFGRVTPQRLSRLAGCPVSESAFRTLNVPALDRARQRTRATVVATGNRDHLALTVSVDPATVDPDALSALITAALAPIDGVLR